MVAGMVLLRVYKPVFFGLCFSVSYHNAHSCIFFILVVHVLFWLECPLLTLLASPKVGYQENEACE